MHQYSLTEQLLGVAALIAGMAVPWFLVELSKHFKAKRHLAAKRLDIELAKAKGDKA